MNITITGDQIITLAGIIAVALVLIFFFKYASK